MHRRRFIATALAAGTGLVARSARAASYPEPGRTIRVVVPFAAGGGVDVLARLYAETLKEKHGLTVVVENRGGGSGTIGGQVVHQAAADGYTLLFSASTHNVSRLVIREVPYDPITDFQPIARVGEDTGWPRLAATIDFKSPLRFEEEFDVFVRIEKTTRKTVQYQFEIARGETAIATGSITTALVSKGIGQPMIALELPPDIVQKLRAAESSSETLG